MAKRRRLEITLQGGSDEYASIGSETGVLHALAERGIAWSNGESVAARPEPGLKYSTIPLESLQLFLEGGKTLGPALLVALTAWFRAAKGRKVRLKVGTLTAEAGSAKELRKILALAEDLDLLRPAKGEKSAIPPPRPPPRRPRTKTGA